MDEEEEEEEKERCRGCQTACQSVWARGCRANNRAEGKTGRDLI
jgi:hypothetical protein